jgi:minor extracellular serine protease Vpr
VITVAATTNSRTFAMFLKSSAFDNDNNTTFATTGTQNGTVSSEIEGDYDLWANYADDNLACSPISGTQLDGKIALIQRGVCTFTTKINHAYTAGAKAVIIYQRDDVEEPIQCLLMEH